MYLKLVFLKPFRILYTYVYTFDIPTNSYMLTSTFADYTALNGGFQIDSGSYFGIKKMLKVMENKRQGAEMCTFNFYAAYSILYSDCRAGNTSQISWYSS